VSDAQYQGQAGRVDNTSLLSVVSFLVRQFLAHSRTSVPVKVVAVHGGGVGPPPIVDVQPLIKQMNGVGQTISHGTVYGIPVKRNQGGANVIINDPKIGDVGVVQCCDRDISQFKANGGAESPPDSQRRHNLSDGVYHGFVVKPTTPNQYVYFRSDGITIQDLNGNSIVTSPGQIAITAGGVTTIFNSTGIHSGADVFTEQATTLETHTHAGGPPPDPGS
jgi:hypothetical protein